MADPATPAQPAIEQRPAVPYAAIPVTVTMASFPAAADACFPELLGWLGASGVQLAGPPFIRYLVVHMEAELEVEFGAPVAGPVPASDRVRGGELPAGRYLTLVHTGPYDGLIAANAAVQDWAAGNGITLESSAGGHRFAGRVEHYRTDPRAEPDPANWQTEVAYLIAP